jgi:thioredoxin reductase (NADPH)
MIESKIIIIGFGPAGIACAIQLKRMGLHPLVIEKDRPGGMLSNANLIENYPGFPAGISGEKLAGLFIDQAMRFDINRVTDEIVLAGYSDGSFGLKGRNNAYQCETLVIACGTIPIVPENIPDHMIDEGFIHFDIRHLKNIKNKTIAIIGAGDAAFDYSLSMAENGNKVFIFNRGDRIRALKVLTEKVFINNNIKYLENSSVISLEILYEKGLKAIFNSASGNKNYSLDYLIFATGRNPAAGFFIKSLECQQNRLISDHRLYLIGDVKNGSCRQVAVAVGDGVRAAMEIVHHESHQ